MGAQPEEEEHEAVVATPAELTFIPSSMEQQADAEDLAIIRELFGSRAQTIINTLLAFDAYFIWYYPLKKSIEFLADMEVREARALDNCRSAIDMHEAFERVCVHAQSCVLLATRCDIQSVPRYHACWRRLCGQLVSTGA